MSRRANLYLQTTTITTSKTVGQIIEVLRDVGADRIMHEYAPVAGQLQAIAFTVAGVPYRLPAKVDRVFVFLRSQRKRINEGTDRTDHQQAERITWRQILYWTQAQLALVQLGMAEVPEVFLPYMALRGGQTLYERIAQQGVQKALPNLDGGE